jgi:hypothetical protein
MQSGQCRKIPGGNSLKCLKWVFPVKTREGFQVESSRWTKGPHAKISREYWSFIINWNIQFMSETFHSCNQLYYTLKSGRLHGREALNATRQWDPKKKGGSQMVAASIATVLGRPDRNY